MKSQKIIFGFAFVLASTPLKAQFSTDAPILLKLLTNAITQLQQLMTMVETGKKNYELLKDLQSGITNIVNFADAKGIDLKNTLYSDAKGLSSKYFDKIYGGVPKTKNQEIQNNSDQMAKEAFGMQKSTMVYTDQLDAKAKAINQQSGSASPKGAARLTAQGVGTLVDASSQSLKINSELLKIQAQTLALENYRDKEQSLHVKNSTDALKKALGKERKSKFEVPRFR